MKLDRLECLGCPIGWHQNQEERESCYDCRPGKYASQTKSIQCAECPMNWFSDQVGGTDCTSCQKGEASHPGGFIVGLPGAIYCR